MFLADPRTFDNLKKLWGLCRGTKKPTLIWVGAGASTWLGYERWVDLAERFHRVFLRANSSYMRIEAARELEAEDYPAVFQRCFDTNSQSYFSLVADAFGPRQVRPVYERFLNALRQIEGVSIVTTNVDEALERSLPDFELVQRTDLARSLTLISSKTPFIAKLHGTVSSVQSTIFTTDDYGRLVNDESYVEVLRSLLTTCSVVFVGYSVRDQYLFELLAKTSKLLSLFGDGPHFLISAEDRLDLPESVNVIRYRTDMHTDHRSGILAVELLRRPSVEAEPLSYDHSLTVKPESAQFLSDFYPGGTWTVSNTAELKKEDGSKAQMLIGPDWSREELPTTLSTAAYDLAVGLICFDRVFFPIGCVGRVHQFLGSDLFWNFASEDVLRFVRWEGFDGLMFPVPDSASGYLATGRIASQTTMEVITRQLAPAPGREADAAIKFALLEAKTSQIDLSGSLNFADVCNGLFVSPATRNMLGLSEGTPAGQIPRWAAGPAMRLVEIARVGATCQMLGLSSMKVMPGAAQIAQVAFSAIAGGILANEAASYALTGQFGVIPEDAISKPEVWTAILRFRNTSVGSSLREYVNRYLLADQGAEIVAAIDASLCQALPPRLLTEARSAMSALLVASRTHVAVPPGIWSDSYHLWNGSVAWRSRARTRLANYLREHNLGPYDICPCGSYEKVKYCCQAALAQ
jgi:SIR2-like domain